MDDPIKSSVDHCREKEMAIDASILASQRPMWDAMKKSITQLVNKITVSNVRNVAQDLSSENLIWGRGLFCSAVLKSSIASHTFAPVFAALVAVINSRFLDVGYLLLKRIVNRLEIACKRDDKHRLLPLVKLLAHLINQRVVHELPALELVFVLLEEPTKDRIEVAVIFVQQCGSAVHESTPRTLDVIFDRFQEILDEANMDKRTECLIEGLFAIRRSRFSGYSALCPELDIVELDDQFTHEISLFNEVDPEMYLDVFHPDTQVLISDDERYKLLRAVVFGEENNEADAESNQDKFEQSTIEDETETELENLRRTIFLTMMSGIDFEDAGQKILTIPLRPNQEMEVCNMLLECCSHQRIYNSYFTLVAHKLCLINNAYRVNFESCFAQQCTSVRLKTYKLHNVAKFFAHLLSSDSLRWNVLAYIRLTEEGIASSSLIFIKVLFQELSEELGIPLLNKRLNDPTVQGSFNLLFPKDNSRNLLFSINFFTDIGLGGLTNNHREHLKKMQKQNQVSHTDEETRIFGTSEQGAASSRSDSKLLKSQQNDDPSKRDGKRMKTS